MNFQNLSKIETSDFYLDVAFRRATKAKKSGAKDRLTYVRMTETSKLDVIRDTLVSDFRKILTAFPELDSLNPFYLELIKCTLDYKSLKKSLGSLNWVAKKVEYFISFYSKRMKRAMSFVAVKKLKRECYGRISSIVKQVKPYLSYLDESRKTMKSYPDIKTSLYTVCIFGFPNVGKSTILSKITSASPEIRAYPFTTKSLNLGYIDEPGYKIQVVDTPGTLNRLKTNNLELQAYLAVKYLTNLIVYVFDPTLEYTFEQQQQLFERLKEFNKPVILFLSKTDVADANVSHEFKVKYSSIITDVLKLKELIKEYSNLNNSDAALAR